MKNLLSPAVHRINKFAGRGDVEGLRAHLRSEIFSKTWRDLDPDQRLSLCVAIATAAGVAEMRTRKPVPKPQRRNKARWDAAAIARLANAYAKVGTGPDRHERVARMLGDISPGGAKVAWHKFVRPATEARQKAA